MKLRRFLFPNCFEKAKARGQKILKICSRTFIRRTKPACVQRTSIYEVGEFEKTQLHYLPKTNSSTRLSA